MEKNTLRAAQFDICFKELTPESQAVIKTLLQNGMANSKRVRIDERKYGLGESGVKELLFQLIRKDFV